MRFQEWFHPGVVCLLHTCDSAPQACASGHRSRGSQTWNSAPQSVMPYKSLPAVLMQGCSQNCREKSCGMPDSQDVAVRYTVILQLSNNALYDVVETGTQTFTAFTCAYSAKQAAHDFAALCRLCLYICEKPSVRLTNGTLASTGDNSCIDFRRVEKDCAPRSSSHCPWRQWDTNLQDGYSEEPQQSNFLVIDSLKLWHKIWL